MSRQTYTYSVAPNPTALLGDITTFRVGSVTRNDTASQVYVDFLPDETATERDSAQSVCTGVTYNLLLQSTDVTAKSVSLWSPLDLANLEYWLDPGHLPHMWIESGETQSPVTNVANAGDAIGQLDDASPSAHYTTATQTTKPPLESDGATECHIRYNGRWHTVQGTQKAFAFLHQTNIFTIYVFVRFEVNGTTQVLFDNCSRGALTAYGITFQRQVANTFFCRIVKGTSAALTFQATTTHTVLAASGFNLLRLSCDGTTLTVRNVTIGWTETFARSSVPDTTHNATSNMTLGAGSDAQTTALNGSVRGILILSRNATTAEDTLVSNYFTSTFRKSVNTLVRLASSGIVNFCRRFYDFTDVTRLWQDNARTVAVASDGDPVAVTAHGIDASDHLGRSATASSTTQRPLYRPAKPGAQWDGVNDNLALGQTDPLGGGLTLIVVAVNLNNATGSHFVASSASYAPITGTGYPNDHLPYITAHPPGDIISRLRNAGPDYNMLEVKRNGTYFSTRASQINTSSSNDSPSTSNWTAQNIGNPFIVGWNMNGYIGVWLLYNAFLSDADVDQYIVPYIKYKFPSLGLG